MEIKITIEKVPIKDTYWEDIKFEYYRNGKNISTWWAGGGGMYLDTLVDGIAERVREDLERYVDRLE